MPRQKITFNEKMENNGTKHLRSLFSGAKGKTFSTYC
jgi:hypothetical protein